MPLSPSCLMTCIDAHSDLFFTELCLAHFLAYGMVHDVYSLFKSDLSGTDKIFCFVVIDYRLLYWEWSQVSILMISCGQHSHGDREPLVVPPIATSSGVSRI